MTGYDTLKRAADVSGALIGLVLSAPVQIAVAAIIRVTMGRPVLFRQERPGLQGKSFTLIKFRTMTPIDKNTGHVSDHDRLGTVGRALRAASLDELPTLYNVLVGDMSLVGPRPLLPEYLERYSHEEARRHEVRPGITGLAQVSGRNEQTWADRLRYDVDYVERRSLPLDVHILLRTIWTVLAAKGITARGHSTMHPFSGTSASLRSASEAEK